MDLRVLSNSGLALVAAIAMFLAASCRGNGGGKAGPTDSGSGDAADANGDGTGEVASVPDTAVPDSLTPDANVPDLLFPDAEPELPPVVDVLDVGIPPDESGSELPDDVPADVSPDEEGGEIIPPPPGPCAMDADCAAWSLVCDPLAGQCVECLFAVPHCPAGWYCKDFACHKPSGCTIDEECSGAELTPYCAPELSDCVACVADEQCLEASECVDSVCVPFTPCESSKQCGDDELCFIEEGKCVGCVLPEDCAAGEECGKDYACHAVTQCESDKQCTPIGMVCDFAAGICRQCLVHGDCPAQYNCQESVCVVDVCLAGSAVCQDNAVLTCNEVGDAYLAAEPCLAEQTCFEAFPGAVCQDWICPAGQAWCDVPDAPETAITCAADGLSIASSVPCPDQGRMCIDGACIDVICPLGSATCDVPGVAVVTCVDKGTKQLAEPCAPGMYCQLGVDKGTASCVPQVCPPDQPVCEGNTASVCNANGSKILPGGIDCASLQQQCYKGQCTVCEAAEKCDGLDNTCNDVVDENPADCGVPNKCHQGACYKPANPNLCKVAVYGGHAYQHCLGQSVNWNEAQAACQAWNGSSLMSLDDKAEHTFLMTQTNQVVWIGYTDAAQEGLWKWLVGDSQFSYFCNNQPDDWQSNEDCAAANFYSGNQGKQGCFNDYACTTKLTEYLCEKQ